MAMDTAAVTATVKEMNDASTAGKTEDVLRLLKKLKTDVEPTEDLLRASRAGVAVGRLRQHATPGVASLAKEIVKLWKEAVDKSKMKRKRDAESAEKDESKRAKPSSPAVGGGKAPDSKSSTKAAADGKASPATPVGGKDSPQAVDGPLSTIDSSRAKPRTAKEDGVVDKLMSDGSDAAGDPVRDKCVVMMYDALAVDSNAQSKIIIERAIAIEREAHKLLNYSTGNDYRAKIRSLFLNLKDKGNPGLRNEIVLGYISAEKVASMSKEDMASESMKAVKQQIAEQNLFKAMSAGETAAETDAFKCGRCQQRRCTYYQMQTRSADEPMTTFVSCLNCGNRWKFS